jgi:DNA-binding response OmpR family regulator
MRIVPADFEARRAELRARREAEAAAALPAAAAAATDQAHAKPSRIIAEQRQVIAEQDALIELLKGALAAAGAQDNIPAYRPWMEALTPQERAVMGALFRCYPRPLDKEALLDLMPGQDHVEDRRPQLVAVKVCHLRRKLGADAIEFVPNLGYRLSAAQHAGMRRAEPVVALKVAA